MKIKISALAGITLDWAVTYIESPDDLKYGLPDWMEQRCRTVKNGEYVHRYHQSWAQAGPIIERERISVRDWGGDDWVAEDGIRPMQRAKSPLVAAMRCYVASKLGDEVEIPEQFLKGE